MRGLFKFGPGVVWPGVAKVVEEMGELQQQLGKLIMVEGRDEVHWSGPLRANIVDEAADVHAAIMFLSSANFDENEKRYFIERFMEKLISCGTQNGRLQSE